MMTIAKYSNQVRFPNSNHNRVSHTPQQNFPKSKPVDIFLFERVGLLIWTTRITHK